MFDYIEIFYNPKHKYARHGILSPVDFKRRQQMRHEGAKEARGYLEPPRTPSPSTMWTPRRSGSWKQIAIYTSRH
ncbi:hypothetical protein BMI87_19765 [Thioclava sp. F28-4]|nr:hypothetical protein BMI87_19765 [Thioclava sp. F28-4]